MKRLPLTAGPAVPAAEWAYLKEVSVLKARVKFRKNGAMKFVGHLDMMRYFQKAMRRAMIPIAFTGGYSPHMVMSFAHPLGVGLTSDGEYFDIELTGWITSIEAVKRLNEVMVEGIEVCSFVSIPEEKKSSGMSIVAAADYRCYLKSGVLPEDYRQQAERYFAQNEIQILKKTKRSEALVDIRPMIYNFRAEDDAFFVSTATGSAQNLKPGLVMESYLNYLGLEPDHCSFNYHRLEVYAESPQGFISLEDLGQEII